MYVKELEVTTRNSEQARRTMIDSDKPDIMKQLIKCVLHQTMAASLKHTSGASESICMKQVIPEMYMNTGNSANCKQTATSIAVRTSIQKLKEYRGDVEETEAVPSKPWQPQGGIGNPRSPREAWEAVGRPGSWEGSSIWKHSGWSQATSKNSKT